VLVWWDYGYWTMTEAHRVPTSIPTQGGARETGEFFIESDEGRARAMLERLRVHDVFVDEQLAFHVDPASRILGKFESLVLWAGADPGRFYATFLFPQNGGFRTAFLYFPDYYRSMAFRLGVMGGEGLPSPGRSAVVSWRLQEFEGQGAFRVVTDVRDFANYPEAAAYLKTLGPGNHAVVGTRPEISPVPVEPIREFTQVYRTPAAGVFARGAVQIFELRPKSAPEVP
jgi:asparagine N-glycosylation enzyme membrane subunit Stt3